MLCCGVRGFIILIIQIAFPDLNLPCLALPCLALPCLALPCLALPCLALPCLALLYLILPCLTIILSLLSFPTFPFSSLSSPLFPPFSSYLTGKNAKELEERMKTGEISGDQDFSVDPFEPHPDFRFSKGSIMSENEWIDLSDNMEKNDGYVKRDPQAMKERPGNDKTSAFTCLSTCLSTCLRTYLTLTDHLLVTPCYRILSNISKYYHILTQNITLNHITTYLLTTYTITSQ